MGRRRAYLEARCLPPDQPSDNGGRNVVPDRLQFTLLARREGYPSIDEGGWDSLTHVAAKVLLMRDEYRPLRFEWGLAIQRRSGVSPLSTPER
jgi:hypothetical protein